MTGNRDDDAAARMERIRQRVAGRDRGRPQKVALGICFGLLLTVAAMWAFLPQQVRSETGIGASGASGH